MDQLSGNSLYHLDRALPERRVLRLTNARGTRIVAVTGDLWITEDGRYDDVVLAPGESAALERDGMAMITTFDSADVEIVPPATAEAKPESPLTERWGIDAEVMRLHMQSARRLRAQAMATAFAHGVEWLRAKLRPAAHTRNECCA